MTGHAHSSPPADVAGGATRSDALVAWLFKPIDAAPLGAFRILFGALMLWDVIDSLRRGRVAYSFLRPHFLFSYDLFPFVTPRPGWLLYAQFVAMGAAALGVMLGLFYRWSACLFAVTYTYVFLLDKAQYNNHYYLIALLAFLLCVVEAQRWGSLDQWRRPAAPLVPHWNLLLLRAQLLLVFFFAGVAKLNPDWLGGEPMRTWLLGKQLTPWIGPWLATDAAVAFFSYGGLFFDLAAGPFLLWRPTRALALAALLGFNLGNYWLFEIGVFPFLMVAVAAIFLPPRQMRATTAATWDVRKVAICAFLAVYLAIQIAAPTRHWFLPGNVGWTEEGQRFSWLMKLRSKSGRLTLWVTDRRSGSRWKADPADDLNPTQLGRLIFTPELIVDYARFVRARLARDGMPEVEVRAETWVSLNRRPPQRLVDPAVDLTRDLPDEWIVRLDDSGRPGTLALAEYQALRRDPARASPAPE